MTTHGETGAGNLEADEPDTEAEEDKDEDEDVVEGTGETSRDDDDDDDDDDELDSGDKFSDDDDVFISPRLLESSSSLSKRDTSTTRPRSNQNDQSALGKRPLANDSPIPPVSGPVNIMLCQFNTEPKISEERMRLTHAFVQLNGKDYMVKHLFFHFHFWRSQ
mmetsp:Transcript_1637/g.5075  ORF Transcript_1637/g.5075 Transcript_1637/m.5075 type:complete len:163 (-) Transcript_1637:150-638(-)